VTKFPECDNHMVIFTSKSDMPTSLAVNPRLRYLYWIDRAQFAKLERAFLNGSNRTTLIKSDLYSPTDLYVDSKSGDVYWSDNTRDRIERCDWDGKNRSVIKSTNLPNPKSVFVLDGVLFYADSRLRSINSVNLSFANTTSNQIKRVNNAPDLNEVIVFSDKSQPSDISSPCASSSGCEQFCFAMPQSSTPKCACGRGELESNGRTCKTPREYLIFAMENEIRSVSFVTGGGEPWRPITGLNRAIGIDFDYRDNKVKTSFYKNLNLTFV
jgi:low density lipoprotein-related protein 2